MTDYCVIPPIISSVAPPLVLFVAGRDHKLFYEAYNDASDLDGDGKLDTTYDHSITYYGYFDPYKCYQYQTSGQKKFVPVSTTSDKFCSTGQWSGNILNWLTMSRIDVLRKVLYGGYRKEDSQAKPYLKGPSSPKMPTVGERNTPADYALMAQNTPRCAPLIRTVAWIRSAKMFQTNLLACPHLLVHVQLRILMTIAQELFWW